MCRAPRRRSSVASEARSAAAASANRSRRRRDEVSTRTSRPVSASTSVRSPTSGSSSSRGSRISTARSPWRAATGASSGSQSRGPRKSDTSATRPPRVPVPARNRRAADRRGIDPVARPVHVGGGGAQHREEARAPAARRDAARLGGAEGEDAEAVAALRGQVAQGERDALGHVGLAPVRGAEGHRRRLVEHEPGGQRALRHVHAHVRDHRAGGDVPVDPAHVVAGLVGADLGELRAAAQLVGAELAGDQAPDPPPDREVEGAQQRLGVGPGPGRAGVRVAVRGVGARVGAAITPTAPPR